jgi:DNA polymerase-3 subunit epsilon
MFSRPIVMLDFETTGLSPDSGGRITEVAALRIEDGRISERFVSLVNCGASVPYFITRLTGISQRMVDSAPPVEEVMPDLLRFIGSDTLAAHNASFDEKFLQAESLRLGLRPQHERLVCSLKLARRLLPGQASYKLSALSSALGIRFSGRAHRAEADAEVSAHLLLQLGALLAQARSMPQVAPELLERVCAMSASRIPAFLGQPA